MLCTALVLRQCLLNHYRPSISTTKTIPILSFEIGVISRDPDHCSIAKTNDFGQEHFRRYSTASSGALLYRGPQFSRTRRTSSQGYVWRCPYAIGIPPGSRYRCLGAFINLRRGNARVLPPQPISDGLILPPSNSASSPCSFNAEIFSR